MQAKKKKSDDLKKKICLIAFYEDCYEINETFTLNPLRII